MHDNLRESRTNQPISNLSLASISKQVLEKNSSYEDQFLSERDMIFIIYTSQDQFYSQALELFLLQKFRDLITKSGLLSVAMVFTLGTNDEGQTGRTILKKRKEKNRNTRNTIFCIYLVNDQRVYFVLGSILILLGVSLHLQLGKNKYVIYQLTISPYRE